MSEILFVEPQSNMRMLQSLHLKRPQLDVPLPCVYIAPYLTESGHHVGLMDMRIESINVLRMYLLERHPQIVGMSIMPGSALPISIRLTSFIKQLLPDSLVVWGGSFPSLHYEFCLNIPGPDIIVCGDGEETLADLADLIAKDGRDVNLSDVAGIAFKSNGQIVTTMPRTPVDLDKSPIADWSIIDRRVEHYLGQERFVSVNAARGCPFSCTFCYNTALYKGFKRYRARSIESVLMEVGHLVGSLGVRKLKFVDDDFLAHKRRGLELSSSIAARYPGTEYHIAARVSELCNEGNVKALSETGCTSAFIGVEVVSDEQLVAIRKGCASSEAFVAAELCAKYNIIPTYSFTFGYPDETLDDLVRMIDMAQAMKRTDARCKCSLEIVSPVAGTQFYDELKEGGMIPNGNPAQWCHLTDWKSAKHKNWLLDGGYHEAFQLAFYLAFGSAGGRINGLRRYSRHICDWAEWRLHVQSLPRCPNSDLPIRLSSDFCGDNSESVTTPVSQLPGMPDMIRPALNSFVAYISA